MGQKNQGISVYEKCIKSNWCMCNYMWNQLTVICAYYILSKNNLPAHFNILCT